MANLGNIQANAALRSPPASSNAAENMELIKLVLHAHNCQRRESQPNGEQSQCTLPHCQNMKDVLHHMTTCQTGRNCTVTGCISSRQIISHWEQCPHLACPVCSPVVNFGLNRESVNANQPNQTAAVGNAGGSEHNSPNTAVNVNDAEFERALYVLGVPYPPSSVQNPQTGTNGGSANSRLFRGGGNPNIVLGLDGNGIQPPTSMSGIIATPLQVSKMWHQSINPDLRNHLVRKLVQALFPLPDPAAMLDPRMCNIVTYAQRVEADMYEMANSRSEYYYLLAEKIYKIQTELAEKRRRREEQARLNLGGTGSWH